MDFIQQFIQALASVRVHSADRFVQYDNFRMHCQQRRQCQALPLSAGQFVQLIAFPPRQTYIFQGQSGTLFRFFRRETVIQQAECYFFPSRQGNQLTFVIFQHQAYLHGQVRNLFPFCRFAQHFDFTGIITAGIKRNDTRHGLTQRSFPRAAGADDYGKRAFFNFNIHIFQHQVRAEIIKIETGNGNHGIHLSSPPSCA